MDNLKVLEPEVVLNCWVHLFQELLLNNATREANSFSLKRLQLMKQERSQKLFLVMQLAHLLIEKFQSLLKSTLLENLLKETFKMLQSQWFKRIWTTFKLFAKNIRNSESKKITSSSLVEN